jgi:ATP-dependent Clp protease ATP-binding subunit ClpC
MSNLPAKLTSFWYPDALVVFLRSFKNTLILLEEDLAIGLMWRLLFVPLFHDSTLVGKGLSFIFRILRILGGLFSVVMVSLGFLILAMLWFLTPFLVIAGILLSGFDMFSYPALIDLSFLPILSTLILLTGISIFLHNYLYNPPKKVWQIKGVSEIFQTTKLKKNDVFWEKLLQSEEVSKLLLSLEVKKEDLTDFKGVFTDRTYDEVLKLAKLTRAKYLTPAYFFVSMLISIPNIETGLLKINLKSSDFTSALVFLEFIRNRWRKVYVWDEDFSIRHLKGVNRGWLGVPTPALDGVSLDITKEALRSRFEGFLGREKIVDEVITILSQDESRNVLLVGPTGAGKSALVNHLAKLIIAGDAPEALATKRIVQIDLVRLIAGIGREGELASRIKEVLDEAEFAGNIIIYLDEIHNLGLGEVGDNLNLYAMLTPYFESSKLQFLASTEAENYARVVEKNSGLVGVFQKIELPPASKEETIEILKEQAVELIRYKGIYLSYKAIKDLAELSSKLIHDLVLPSSALKLLKESEVLAKEGKITSEIIKEVLERKISVPLVELDTGQKEMLLKLEDIIHKRLIDQKEAVKVVADTLRRSATSLREENRPIGSFLFVGPTGVGKTELSKTLAEVYFKNPGAYLRFDMSEYQTEQAVDRLIGTAEIPGELTEAVRNKPYCLLLLDEFEKANPKILTLFLQVLDDGRLTGADGKTTDFTNTIIIATSNAASLLIAEDLRRGYSVSQIEPQVKEELLKLYKPELVNRFDNIVIFKPLAKADLEQIVLIKLSELKKKLTDQGYIVEFDASLIGDLGRKGFDPILGARPLRRLIQDTIEANLSKMILENKLVKGQSFKADSKLLGD